MDGFFFLQRTDKDTYLARFYLNEFNIKHFANEIDINSSELHREGMNLSAIRLKDMKMRVQGTKIPDIPALELPYNVVK